VQARVDELFVEFLEQQVHEQVPVLEFGLPQACVKFTHLLVLEFTGQQAEALGAAALDDRCNQHAVDQPFVTSVTRRIEQSFDVQVRLVFAQCQSALCTYLVDFPEVLKFLAREVDQVRNHCRPIRVLDDEAHGHGRCLALAVGVIEQEGIEIPAHDFDPGR